MPLNLNRDAILSKIHDTPVPAPVTDDPDKHAENLSLSESTGIPADVVSRNRPEIDKKQKLFNYQRVRDYMNEVPEAKEWLSDKDNAALVSDDFSYIGQLSTSLRSIPNEILGGADSLRLHELSSRQLWGDLDPLEMNEYNALKKITRGEGDFSNATTLETIIRSSAFTLPQFYEQGKAFLGGGLLGGTATGAVTGGLALATGPGAIPAAGAGFTAGFFPGGTAGLAYENFIQQSGAVRESMMEIQNDQGQGLDPNVIRGASFVAGALNATLDIIPFKKLANTIPGIDKLGQKFLGKEAIKELMANPAAQKVFYKYGKRIAEAGLAEGSVEAIQEIIQMSAEEIAKDVSDAEFQPITFSEAASRSTEAFRVGSLTGVGLATPGSVVGATAEVTRNRNRSPEEVKAHVEQINEEVKNSRLYQRSPERFHALVNSLTKDERLYINADAMQQALATISEEEQSALFNKVPELKLELENSAYGGGEISIKKGDYATYLAPVESFAMLSDHIKLDPADVSVAERQQYQEFLQQNPAIIQSVEPSSTPQVSEQVLEKIFRRALREGGRSSIEAKNVAPLFARTITRLSESFGENPAESLIRQNVEFQTVTDEQQAIASGSTLDVLLQDVAKVQAGEDIGDPEMAQVIQSFTERLQQLGINTQEMPDADTVQNALYGAATDAGITLEQSPEGTLQVALPDLEVDPELMQRFAERYSPPEPPQEIVLQQQERGSITFSKDFDGNLQRVLVAFTSRANLSTAIHEFSHFAVDLHRTYAQRARELGEAAPMEAKRVLADWESLKQQVGAESDNLTVDQEEEVARLFEAYAREGKAPAERISKVFSRFRRWLTAIYRNVKELGVELNDEVRGVFDRWLASEDEIAAVKGKNTPLTEVAAAAGLDASIVQQIDDYVQSSIANAEEKLYKQLDREQKRRESKAYAEQFDKMRRIVVSEFNRKPVYSLINDLRNTGSKIYTGPEVDLELLGQPPQHVVETLPADQLPVNQMDLNNLTDEQITSENLKEYVLGVLSQPRPKEPKTLTRFIASKGGLKEQSGELKTMGIDGRKGRGLLNNKSGLDFDRAREAAMEEGYLEPDTSVADFLYALRGDFTGTDPVYRQADQGDVGVYEEYTKAEELADRAGIDVDRELKKRTKKAQRNLGRYGDILTEDQHAEGAVDPEITAQMHGYKTAREMFDSLFNAPNFDGAVDRETRSRLMAKFPDMIEQKRIRNEAVDAIVNDRVLLALDLMVKEMGRRTGKNVNIRQFAKALAQEQLGKMKVADASYAFRHEAARERNIREALRSARGGDPEAALDFLQKAMINQITYKSLQDFNETKDKAFELFKRVNDKDKTLAKVADIDFVGAARHVLFKFGLGKEDFAINKWLADIQERHPDVQNDLIGFMNIVGTDGKPYKELTIPEFMDVYNSVENIFHTARQMQEFKIGEQKLQTEIAVSNLTDVLGSKDQLPELEGTSVYGMNRVRRKISSFKAMQRRVEHWVQSMDDGDSGPFRKYLWEPISEAASAYRDARSQWTEQLNAIFEKHRDHMTASGKIDAPEMSRKFRDRLELIGFLLHTGNASNLDKLLGGYGIQPESFRVAMQKMEQDGRITERDWQIVQELWDYAEALKPLSQKAHRELYGYRFEEIDPAPVQTTFGTFRGGYWPAIVDYDQVDEKLTDVMLDQFKRFSLASTNKGFTKTRNAAYRRPLSTDLRIASQHVNHVLLFSYMEPAVRKVSRVMNNRDFMSALSNVDTAARTEMLEPWLRRSAWQTVTDPIADGGFLKPFNPAFRFLNKTVSRNAMMGNISNAIQNYTSFPIAIREVGARSFARAFVRSMVNPRQTFNEIREMSSYMRGRQNVNDIVVTQQINTVVLRRGHYKRLLDVADRYGYIFQRITQNQVDNITWLAAYNNAVESGKNEEAAIKSADAIVRRSMGSLNPEDISAIESGSEASKLFLKFYSWFNNLANYVGTDAAKIIRDSGWKGTPQLFYLYVMAVAMPAVLGDLVTKAMGDRLPEDDDDDGQALDDWIAWATGSQVRFASAMIPFGGTMGNALVSYSNDESYDDRITVTPFVQQFERTARFVSKTAKGKYRDDSQQVRDGLSAIGFMTGLPLSQPAKPASFIADVAEGDVDPDTLEYIRGLIGGPPPNKR